MVHVCVVPGCSNRSDRETHLSFHCLPLKNKKLLKVWIHKIGRKNLLNNNSRVCSTHFSNAVNRVLRPDEVPTINLPNVTTPVRKRKSPVKRLFVDSGVENENISSDSECEEATTPTNSVHAATQTLDTLYSYAQLQDEITVLLQKVASSLFRLSNIEHDDRKVQFYTGFPNYRTLKACYDFLGPAVNSLNYWGSNRSVTMRKNLGERNRSLPSMEEFF